MDDYVSISRNIGISVVQIAIITRDWDQLDAYEVILVDEA